ncbi:MAG: N-acetylglucosamine-6-phosphate deacetylase, partial [Acidobacteriaceae bacterium]|nr:N-acetylglucosamine-6-phosphate deacetylase [Acidobacteriaceae bacterium]
MKTVITAGRLITPDRTITDPVVVVDDEVISQIAPRAEVEIAYGQRLDFPGCILVPALFDVHIHGSAGRDVMEGTREAFTAIGKFLAS